MREILFRGKRKDNGEWIEGIPIKTYDTEIGINLPLRYNPKNITLMNNDRVLLCCAMDDSAYFDTEDYPIIDDETVGQYTGMKDKNFTRIFEGDVIRIEFQQDFYIGEVYWADDFLGWVVKFLDGTTPETMELINFYNTKYVEVIGNIHDHPELRSKNGK